MQNQQLEIGLKSPSCRRRHSRRQIRLTRARWWFNQMRRVVDEAAEWQPTPLPPIQPRLPQI